MKLKELLESKLNYTGIFFKDGKHMTWKYGRPLEYPKGVSSGDSTEVTVVGKYSDKDVSCLIVKFKDIDKQKNGTLLHITTRVENGAKPADSGKRATKNGYKKIDQYTLKGHWR